MRFYGEDENQQPSNQTSDFQKYYDAFYQNPEQDQNSTYNQAQPQNYNNAYGGNSQHQNYSNTVNHNPQYNNQNYGYNPNMGNVPQYNQGHYDPDLNGEFKRPDFESGYPATKKPTTLKDKIKGIAVVVWFAVSIFLGMGLTAITGHPGWVLTFFGQLFLACGIMVVASTKNKLENAIIFIFPLAGAGLMVGGLLWLFGSDRLFAKLSEIFPFLILGLFFIAGLGLVIFSPLSKKLKLKRCTVPVMATVIDLRRRYSRRRSGKAVYRPVLEYYYKNKSYKNEDSQASNFGLPKLGDQMQILVNDNDPNEFYCEWGGKTAMPIIMGCAFMVFSSVAILLMLL